MHFCRLQCTIQGISLSWSYHKPDVFVKTCCFWWGKIFICSLISSYPCWPQWWFSEYTHWTLNAVLLRSASIPGPLPAVPQPKSTVVADSFDGPLVQLSHSALPTNSAHAETTGGHLPVTNAHPMVTWAKASIHRPKQRSDGTVRYPFSHALADMASSSSTEPTCYTQAVRSPEWRAAMANEFNALLKNQMWSLVPPHSSQNPVGCKWVFKIKRHANGSIEHYKARLMANGYHQQYGFDYDETVSPVVKPTTIHLVLSLAISQGWSLRQLDVKNAFCHGVLREDVYMTQPPWFVDPSFPSHVCMLHKAIYGLKQAPRAWFQRFSSFLICHGFRQSQADPPLFIFRHEQYVMFLLLYMDDIVLIRNIPSVNAKFLSLLNSEFEIFSLALTC